MSALAVPIVVTVEQLREELADVAEYAAAPGLMLDESALTDENPVFHMTFHNRDGVPFHVEFDCREYPLHPPTIEFVDATKKSRGTRDLYPNVFHNTPCVCARYNRKAYEQYGGPHNDWRLIDWQLPTGAGPKVETLGIIVSDLHSKIAASSGRMA